MVTVQIDEVDDEEGLIVQVRGLVTVGDDADDIMEVVEQGLELRGVRDDELDEVVVPYIVVLVGYEYVMLDDELLIWQHLNLSNLVVDTDETQLVVVH